MQERPLALVGAVVVQVTESAGLCAAAVFAGIDTAAGQSYQAGSGIALTVIALVTAAGLAVVAAGLAGLRRWSRTPALLTQLFAGGAGIYLIEGHRYDWGMPALLLAAAGLVALLVPPSLRALAGGDHAPRPTR
jgi:hypothetical protein